MKKLIAAVALLSVLILKADTVSTIEIDQPVEVVNDGTAIKMTVPIWKPGATHTVTLTPINGTWTAQVKIRSGKVPSNPPMPPQLISVATTNGIAQPTLLTTALISEDSTNWSDFPPDFVMVPKEKLADGAHRQWGTIFHTNYTQIKYRGEIKPVILDVIKSTNYLMRIVKPLVEISEPVSATPTNVTNF